MLDQLNCDALAEAERAAAARPGVSGRMEQAIEHIIANGHVQAKPNSIEKRDADDHFEGEPAANGLVWRHINGHWVTGVQEFISVFSPDTINDESETEHVIHWSSIRRRLLKILMRTWFRMKRVAL